MIFVGIPVLSRFDLLEKAVGCIDVPYELFVVDNSSNNRGVAASWNAILREGFDRGYGWVFIGNDDCFVGPGTIQKALDCIKK
jgi:GT2 family glycosyltransferase